MFFIPSRGSEVLLKIKYVIEKQAKSNEQEEKVENKNDEMYFRMYADIRLYAFL